MTSSGGDDDRGGAVFRRKLRDIDAVVVVVGGTDEAFAAMERFAGATGESRKSGYGGRTQVGVSSLATMPLMMLFLLL